VYLKYFKKGVEHKRKIRITQHRMGRDDTASLDQGLSNKTKKMLKINTLKVYRK